MSKKHTVRSYYDQYAANYDSFYESIQRDKFLHIQSYLNSKPYIIDLGGGSGISAEWIDSPVINLDISVEMLRKGLVDKSFIPVVADLEYLPFRSNSIDQFISLTAYQNTSDIDIAIRELNRVLTSSVHGVITLLKKTTELKSIISLFDQNNLESTRIPFNGEDYCFTLHR